MKAIAKLFIVAVIVLGAQSSHAKNPHPRARFKVLKEQSFALYLDQLGQQKVKISLLDAKGNILYVKTIRHSTSFKRKINLRQLPEGNYSLEIRDAIGTESYPIAVLSNSLTIEEDKMVTTFNPILRKSDKTVSLSLFSPSKQPHTVKIYNDKSELVHDEEIAQVTNYNKQFDFSEALPGSYNIVINSRGHEYSYIIPVK